MTHEDLQDLKDQGYIVKTWRAIPDEHLHCPKCESFNEWGWERQFPNDQKEVEMYCPKCGGFWEAPLRERYTATYKPEEVTE